MIAAIPNPVPASRRVPSAALPGFKLAEGNRSWFCRTQGHGEKVKQAFQFGVAEKGTIGIKKGVGEASIRRAY